jgi:hypothetical protein
MQATRIAVAAVSVIYLLATLSELADGTTLLGAIPVDMRDRIIHPLIAGLAAAALAIGRRHQTPAPAVSPPQHPEVRR